ncbi:PAS/PAC sensor signal transduction histidine kinase [Geosporobacter subterraneus DSM 17957]|uniref:histidine kinase n=1 Tax=Geosporobacter subterraneus DSM 17957 TaxID=1121919 RepID=A0A1M6KFZ0_9FIRM|nr:ATP-binding protein [Geosporobacter subterraneus]SHJ57817.1 PAS/PAC sensor signal transduction histidine kinase [Geosporobacter subterraneus DSM 17957]
MFKSIRWKFITIYFLLVFMAMVIVGVFIIQQFQDYHLGVVSENLTKIARNYFVPELEGYADLDENKAQIQEYVDTWDKALKLKEDVFIVNPDFQIIASSNELLVDKSAVDVLEHILLSDARRGQISEKDKLINTGGDRPISVKNIVFPIKNATGKVTGILYFRADLSDINKTLDESRMILIQATLLALVITVVLGFLIARSVTEPISDVTVKAAKMARGDFDQIVEVKSDDEIGQLAAMFNYLREKLKITLSEISREKSKLETILDYMADGLIAVNNEGLIVHANPTALKMLNLTKEETETKAYDELIGHLNEQLTLKYIDESGSDWVGSEVIRQQDSIYQVNYAPFKDEKGEKTGIVMVLQDITERQKLDNMRKEFVANVSHELKTPLTSIKSYTETLLDGALDNRELSEQFLQVVNSEADRMSRLVKDLLQLSSLDYKQVKWNKKDADLVKIVESCVLKLNMTAKNKQQKIKFMNEGLPIVGYMDIDKIEQVVLNIMSNAIKYTPDGGEINVYLTQDESGAKIRVVDNGIGIPSEDLPRLFERFYRVDKARSRELGGTGLGLSIARQIVEAHEGQIEILSNYGEGTEVVINLPLQEKAV